MSELEVHLAADQLAAVDELWACLQNAPSLTLPSPQRDGLWVALWRAVTTRATQWVCPVGSTARIRVTSEHADAELIAAWEWLTSHEDQARAMGPAALHACLRSAATRAAHGSARAANADSMHGLTAVPAGTWLSFGGSDVLERIA